MIAVVDYGMGNLRSVAKAIEHVAPTTTVRVTSDPAVVSAADRVVFPGQGAMPDCMRYLRESGLEDAVRAAATSRSPCWRCASASRCCSIAARRVTRPDSDSFPARSSVFATRRCLRRMARGSRCRTWAGTVCARRRSHPLWDGVADDSWFYFVHSYYVVPLDRATDRRIVRLRRSLYLRGGTG